MSKACNLIGMILLKLALAHTCFHADIITDLLSKANLPQAEIDDAVDFMLVLIERHSGNGRCSSRIDVRKPGLFLSAS
jgi:hypothetical protein